MTFWNNKAVSITGAASGIGFALAKELSQRGARVWLTDINAEAVAAAAQSIGNGARSSVLDVRSLDAFRAHIKEVNNTCGQLDALFNNAGIAVGGIAHELDASHFDVCAAINITGVSNGVVAAYPGMVARRSGLIVNTASAAGLLALPSLTPYAMSKHAVVGLSKSLRIEGAEHNVQICALCPTAIDTPLIEARNPKGTPDIWLPNVREFLTEVGGPPYPVDKFAYYAINQIEKNKGIIVAPLAARVRLALAKFLPAVVETIIARAYRKQLDKWRESKN